MGLGDYLILAGIAVMFIAALIYIIWQKRHGKCIGCSSDCSSCCGCGQRRGSK